MKARPSLYGNHSRGYQHATTVGELIETLKKYPAELPLDCYSSWGVILRWKNPGYTDEFLDVQELSDPEIISAKDREAVTATFQKHYAKVRGATS